MIVIYMFVFVCFFSSTLFREVRYYRCLCVVVLAVVVDVILSSTVFFGCPSSLGLSPYARALPSSLNKKPDHYFAPSPSFVNI